MQSQILVPLDGTSQAATILTPVLLLARATGRGLTLVRALPPDSGSDPLLGMRLPPEAGAAQPQRTRQAVADYLAATARLLDRPGCPVQTAILDGAPAGAILAYAQRHPEVQLIAMATHGRRGVPRWIFGSVAEEVLQQVTVPLLLLRWPGGPPPEHTEPTVKTIVVPVDPSGFGEAALALAHALAQATGARLVLQTAVAGLDAGSAAPDEVPPWRQREYQAEVDRLVEYQEHLAAPLAAAGLGVGMQIEAGPPAAVILRLSAEVQADLIVMATHGRTGLERLRRGSVALAVLERAPRPVLLLRVPRSAMPAATAAAGRGIRDAVDAGPSPGTSPPAR